MIRARLSPTIILPALAALALIASCGLTASSRERTSAPAEPAPAATPQAPRSFTGTSRAGRYLVAWKAVGRPIPLNEPFELDLELRRAEDHTPVSGADVYVHAAMPEHNHGMLREPRAHEVSPGVYRVEGMLLHMEGYWQIYVDVIEKGVAETTDFELTLE